LQTKRKAFQSNFRRTEDTAQIIEEYAEEKELVCHSFGADPDSRKTIVWKKEFAPTDDRVIEMKIEYDPQR